jgi:hypothetical protein
MQRALLLILVAVGIFVVARQQASAQSSDMREMRVQFPRGATRTTIEDRITGYEIVDYKLGASAGQGMTATLETDDLGNYFNVMAPGEADVAFFIGSRDGNRFEGELPETGDYTIRVYLMRSAARHDETAGYRLEVAIAAAGDEPSEVDRSGSAARLGDFADGLSGGPDFWEVTGVSQALNLRRAPSTTGAVVVQLADGAVLRNLGCRISEGRRWCEVERREDPSVHGWVAGDYLSEGPAYPGAAGVASGDALVAGSDFSATGEVPCARYFGQPMASCRFGVRRKGNGSGLVTVFWPDGGSRVISSKTPLTGSRHAPRAPATVDRALPARDSRRASVGDRSRVAPPGVRLLLPCARGGEGRQAGHGRSPVCGSACGHTLAGAHGHALELRTFRARAAARYLRSAKRAQDVADRFSDLALNQVEFCLMGLGAVVDRVAALEHRRRRDALRKHRA